MTCQFLIRRTDIDPESVVCVDEMMYGKEAVGSKYGWAPSDRRAIQLDDAGKTPGVMFIAAMSTTEVLPITLAVPQPVTVTGFVFEWWVEHFLIPDMVAKGKDMCVLDNARPHRRRILRALFTPPTCTCGSCPSTRRGSCPWRRCS